jgi:predicted flap endonuclease-1-like 5' DNA nuclease
VRIRYIGRYGRRLACGFEWTQGGVVDVADAEAVAQLFTNSLSDFEIAPDEPLLAIVGAEMTPNLALAGVASLADLAGLDKAGVKRVAETIRVEVRQVGEWVKQAKAALGGVEQPQEVIL